MMRALAISLMYLLLVSAAPVRAEQDLSQSSRDPPLCRDASTADTAECWILQQARSGKVANLGEYCKEQKNLDAREDLDPRNSEDARWRHKCRVIGTAFIKRVLTEKPWHDVLIQGLRVLGAQVTEPLDLSSARITPVVWLDKSRFEGDPINLSGARFDNMLSFEGSVFEHGLDARALRVDGSFHLGNGASVRNGALILNTAKVEGDLSMIGSAFESGVQADRLQVGGSLFLRAGAAVRGGKLVLTGAKVESNLEMDGSTFENGVQAGSLQVGGSLLLREGAAVRGGKLVLIGAKVESNLEMDGSTFENGIQADNLQVGGNLFLREGAAVRGSELVLVGAKVGGDLDMGDSTFENGVHANSMLINGHLYLRNSTFAQSPEISFSRIEGRLDLSGATLPSLNLSNTVVVHDFGLAPRPQWGEKAQLILRNAQVGAVQDQVDDDGKDSWPGHLDHQGSLDLQGFVYDRLGGYGGEQSMLQRDAAWFEGWLARDPTFTRQPYQQLAAVFRAAGDPDRADAVLYAARDRELAWKWHEGECGYGLGLVRLRGECWEAAGLGLLRITIGYGLGSGFFLILVWVAVFTALGVFVLWFSLAARAKGLLWRVGASLDHLLPIVELNKEFTDFFDDPKHERLAGWQLAYFAVQALIGYVLASFVVAGLAGLTQAQ
jgi:hypothetical protein